jgi:hypothetical protein
MALHCASVSKQTDDRLPKGVASARGTGQLEIAKSIRIQIPRTPLQPMLGCYLFTLNGFPVTYGAGVMSYRIRSHFEHKCPPVSISPSDVQI